MYCQQVPPFSSITQILQKYCFHIKYIDLKYFKEMFDFETFFFLTAIVHEQSASEISSPGHPEEPKVLNVFVFANESN